MTTADAICELVNAAYRHHGGIGITGAEILRGRLEKVIADRPKINLTLPYPPSVNNLYLTLLMEKKNSGAIPTLEERARRFLIRLGDRHYFPADFVAFAKSEIGLIHAVRVPSGEAKKYKNAVAKICAQQRVRPFSGEVRIDLKVYRPRRIGDLDGTFKALIDGLKGFAFLDDKQIVEIHAARFDDKDNPRVEVEVTDVSVEQELFSDQKEEEIPFS